MDITITPHAKLDPVAALQTDAKVNLTVSSPSGLSLDAGVKKKTEARQAASSGYTVSISEQAREQLRMESSGQQESGGGSSSGVSSGALASGGETTEASDSAQQRIDAIKKQIEAVQKRLEKAREKLAEAQAAQASGREEPGPENPDAAAAPSSAEEPPAVKAAQAEVNQLTGQLAQLNHQLQEAMKELYGVGGGGGGGIQGTRCSGGLGKSLGHSVAHIGSGTDPYAAARAAEQAEMGGGGGSVSF